MTSVTNYPGKRLSRYYDRRYYYRRYYYRRYYYRRHHEPIMLNWLYLETKQLLLLGLKLLVADDALVAQVGQPLQLVEI